MALDELVNYNSGVFRLLLLTRLVNRRLPATLSLVVLLAARLAAGLEVDDFAESWRWRQFDPENFAGSATILGHGYTDDMIYVGTQNGALFRYDGFRWARITTGASATPESVREIVVTGSAGNEVYVVTSGGLWQAVRLNLILPGVIGMLYLSWLASWWSRRQLRENGSENLGSN